MKIRFILTTLSILASLSSLSLSAQGLEGKKQVDFGKINKTSVRTLTLHNRSKTPVVIIASSVDCNCTRIDYSPRPIMAGDSTIVKITYVPNKDKGAFYKSVTLKNSTKQDFKFIVRGTVL